MTETIFAESREHISELLRETAQRGERLAVTGNASKDWLANPVFPDRLLVMQKFSGIEHYEPSELCIRVRAGTPLRELQEALAAEGQQLAAEPPDFSGATVGGAVAAGLSGPGRPYAGALRDQVLGAQRVDGLGQPGRFGGEVMKNVAGYDVSRLMAGSFGTLGVLTTVSFKVLPLPECSETRVLAVTPEAMQAECTRWRQKYVPVSATCWHAGLLHVRVSGAEPAVRAFAGELGGELMPDAADFWCSVRDQTHEMFAIPEGSCLWRLAVNPLLPFDPAFMPKVIEWGGAERWLPGPSDLRQTMQLPAASGHLSPWRGWPADEKPDWLDSGFGALPLMRTLQRELDPHQIFCSERIFAEGG